MTTWTPITKQAISWVEPPPAETSGVAYEFLVGGGYKLNIGGGYNLTIQPATVEIQYTNIQKVSGHVWPGIATSTTNYIDIGSGYNLLVGGGYKLLVGEGRSETPWTPVDRSTGPLS